MGVRQSVQCSQCGKSIVRVVWNYGKNRSILDYFCDNVCKGSWQRAQREAKGFTREWLFQKYIVEKMDCTQIAKIAQRDPKQVWQWITDYGITTRSRGFASAEYGFRKGEPSAFLGHKHTPEYREQMRLHAIATGRVPYNPLVGSYMKGKKGAETPQWKGGITPERQAFYRSDEWKEACKATWRRADARCERCGIHHNEAKYRGTFHVHHIISFMVRELRAKPSNLVLLCRKCHLYVHSNANTNKEFIGEYQSAL